LLDVVVRRPEVVETTALGAAYLAGLAVGVWSGLDDVRDNWRLDREFQSQWDDEIRQLRYARWKKAVERSLDWEEHGS
jgi:glycerol kinase